MANKSKTIKNASDEELRQLIMRLRDENQLQDLIVSLRRKSENDPNGSYEGYYRNISVSTEMPIEDLYHYAMRNKKNKLIGKNFLSHYGVLGMRWGVRDGSGQSTAKGSEDHNRSQQLRKKPLSQMSNEELRLLTSRMQLERSYKDLKKSQKNAGSKLVDKILGRVGDKALSSIVDVAVETAVKTVFEEAKKTSNKQ